MTVSLTVYEIFSVEVYRLTLKTGLGVVNVRSLKMGTVR